VIKHGWNPDSNILSKNEAFSNKNSTYVFNSIIIFGGADYLSCPVTKEFFKI
jgi:hypothetical protein